MIGRSRGRNLSKGRRGDGFGCDAMCEILAFETTTWQTKADPDNTAVHRNCGIRPFLYLRTDSVHLYNTEIDDTTNGDEVIYL